MDPSSPLATAEFLVVDTETNGLGGERCELTEIGAVLVGGGELHDRWETLVAAPTPLSRGIQRFTGITQAMVDQAPPADAVLPELARLLHGRVLVAHSAGFDRRVLRQAFERAGLGWPSPPVLCTVALARRFAPLVRQRRLAALAGSLGIDVEVQHRALPDAETCARVFCALFARLCAAATTIEDALGAGRAAARAQADPRAAPAGQRADQARGPLRLHPLPLRHRLSDARGVAAAGGGTRGQHRAAARAPPRRRARRAAELAVRPAPLRAQAAAARPPVGLRADGPLPVAVSARPGPERLPRAAR